MGVLNFFFLHLSFSRYRWSQGMSLFSGGISAPATPRVTLNPETPGASQLFVKVRSPFLPLPRGPWKEDSKSKYASNRPLMGGEDPGVCCEGSASQVLVSLSSSLE